MRALYIIRTTYFYGSSNMLYNVQACLFAPSDPSEIKIWERKKKNKNG